MNATSQRLAAEVVSMLDRLTNDEKRELFGVLFFLMGQRVAQQFMAQARNMAYGLPIRLEYDDKGEL